MKWAVLACLIPCAAHAADPSLPDLSRCDGLQSICKIGDAAGANSMWQGFCMGYVIAAASAGISEKLVCLPDGITNGQSVKVVEKWLDDNPSALHLSPLYCVQIAMGVAFPCKPAK